jgi:hypothetical protein
MRVLIHIPRAQAQSTRTHTPKCTDSNLAHLLAATAPRLPPRPPLTEAPVARATTAGPR